jgi:hypothetical protein
MTVKVTDAEGFAHLQLAGRIDSATALTCPRRSGPPVM